MNAKPRPTDEELMRYMRSPAFKRRAKKMQARIVEAAQEAGRQSPSFDEIAKALRIPVDVAIGGFMHSMAKAGRPVVQVGRVH